MGAARFSPDGALVALAPTPEALLLVDAASGETLAQLETPQAFPVSRISLNREQAFVATNSWRIQIWHLGRLGAALRGLELSDSTGLIGHW